MEVWSGHAQLLRTIHLIVLCEYIMKMLYKKCFINSYDALKALKEQLRTHT